MTFKFRPGPVNYGICPDCEAQNPIRVGKITCSTCGSRFNDDGLQASNWMGWVLLLTVICAILVPMVYFRMLILP